VAADLETVDVDLDTVGDVGRLGLDGQRGEVLVDATATLDVTDQDDLQLDRDLLALTDEEQVDVVDRQLERVTLDGLRQRQLLAAIDLDRQQGVGTVLDRVGELTGRQRDVAGSLPVAVQHGGDLSGPARAACAALAELSARLGGDSDLGHDLTPRTQA
jgi:hypothetical protein